MSAHAHESGNPGDIGIIAPLTGIRGFAALWVVSHHLSPWIEAFTPGWQWLHRITWYGYLGVDLFAVLSGFVISLTYAERLARVSAGSAARFLWLRIARIYPLVLFVLGLYLLGEALHGGAGAVRAAVLDASFWLQVGMLNGWGLEDSYKWNVPSWSVSSEWLCYLLFPIVAPLIARIRSGALAAALALGTLTATIGLMTALGYPDFSATFDWGLLRIAGQFLTGCFLYVAYRSDCLRALPWGPIGAAAALVALAGCLLNEPRLTVVSFVALVYALAWARPPLLGAFGNPASVYLGEISYTIYMVHYWVLVEFSRSWGGRPAGAGLGVFLVGIFATTILLSVVIHRFVEQPARSRMRKLVAPVSTSA